MNRSSPAVSSIRRAVPFALVSLVSLASASQPESAGSLPVEMAGDKWPILTGTLALVLVALILVGHGLRLRSRW